MGGEGPELISAVALRPTSHRTPPCRNCPPVCGLIPSLSERLRRTALFCGACAELTSPISLSSNIDNASRLRRKQGGGGSVRSAKLRRDLSSYLRDLARLSCPACLPVRRKGSSALRHRRGGARGEGGVSAVIYRPRDKTRENF